MPAGPHLIKENCIGLPATSPKAHPGGRQPLKLVRLPIPPRPLMLR
jgi:hypothetical protein